MKGVISVAIAASLAAGVAAQPHAHQHLHRHAKHHEHGSPVDKRAVAVSYVTPVETVYVLDGQEIDASQAQGGISSGLYSIIGETTPTFSPPPPPSSTSTPVSSSSTEDAQFFELKASSTSSSTSVAPTTTAQTSTAAPATSSSTSSGGTGLDAEFPSGKILCSAGVPTDYGAIALDWLGTEGWASIETVPSWNPGVLIDQIVEPISGGCPKSSFCQIACPPGYDSTQWPETSQGATGQSIGGLWCNDDGYLELTRPEYTTLCTKTVPGVYIKNNLNQVVSTCKTCYPGNEKMSIPFVAQPGETVELTNPYAPTAYKWEGSSTTAQYYINPAGLGASDACLWLNPTYPTSAGNYAPMNLGVGTDDTNTTYISIFPNSPSSSATLEFSVTITGDVNSKCAYSGGSYTGGGNGCTTTLLKGGTAYVEFS